MGKGGQEQLPDYGRQEGCSGGVVQLVQLLTGKLCLGKMHPEDDAKLPANSELVQPSVGHLQD